MKKELSPWSRGFDKSFVYLAGSGNHYNNEPQLEDTGGFVAPVLCADNLWMRDGEVLDRKKDMPSDFYSTKDFTDNMVQYLQERTAEEKEKPFFAYLAYTAPHWPLQAPRDVIDKYKGIYNDGPDALRNRRLEALKARGLVPADVEPAPMVGEWTKPWADMTPDEQAHSARHMETYAAMVDLIDQHLARVIKQLEDSGELDNTLILFMSDNGAEGKLLEAMSVTRGMPMEKVIERFYDNSFENIGNANSFVWYGPRWACAATAPSRGFKAMVTEGGIRCPCIVRYPKSYAGGESARVTHDFTTVMDVLPTFLDMAGVTHPAPTFRGREVVAPRGRSWLPFLEGRAETVHEEDEPVVMGWELFERRAIRKGMWKAVYEPAPVGSDEWELYDLSKDQGELHNLAKEEPEILNELLEEWEKYFAETGMYDPGAEAPKGSWPASSRPVDLVEPKI